MHSPWFRSTFCRALEFLQIKEWWPSFWGDTILEKVWIICLPVQCFNFKSFMDPNSSLFIRLSRKSLLFGPPLLHLYFKRFMGQNSLSFIRFQCILHDWGVLFAVWKFPEIKEGGGDLISGGNIFCRKSEFFRHPFCISILKVWWTQIHRHSLDLNAFCIIQE